jgi:hypothetical protein
MSTTQEQLLKAVATGLAEVPERHSGYRTGLKATLTEVLKLERQHLEQHTDIKIKIKDQCKAAGDLLYRQTKAASVHASDGGEGAS